MIDCIFTTPLKLLRQPDSVIDLPFFDHCKNVTPALHSAVSTATKCTQYWLLTTCQTPLKSDTPWIAFQRRGRATSKQTN